MGKKEKKFKKTNMLRSVGKKSGKSVESVLKKKRKAIVRTIYRKERFQAGNKRVRSCPAWRVTWPT